MAKKKLGKILIIPKGDYDAAVLYRRLDLVKYNGTSYLCKKDNTIGIEPTNIERWYKVVDAVGDMDIFFEEVSKRENISSSDPLSLILGKIKKWFDDLKPVAFSGKYKDLVDTPQNATISVAGLMSEKDKKKLDDITESADSVSYSASLTNGTKVGTIRINGEDYELYAPTNTDTKNTAGAKDSTQKLYLIGATSQANAPQTYSQDTAYVGTDGCIYSNNKKTITIGEVSRSAAITVQGNYALDAIEKNASIEGTLAYLISSQNTVLTNSINQLNSNMNTKISAENFSYNWVAAGADYVCTIHRAGLLMIKRGTAAKLCAINPEGVVTIALEYGNESELYFAQDITIEPIPPDNDWHKVMLHNNARSGIYVFRLSI